jgi:phage terminase large subunit
MEEQPLNELSIETARIFEPLLQPSRYKGVYGGRGSRKSHFMAGAVVEHCLLKPNSRIVCIREVQKTLAQSAKLLIENKIQEFGVGPSLSHSL